MPNLRVEDGSPPAKFGSFAGKWSRAKPESLRILNSSAVIAAERRRDTPEQLVQQVTSVSGNQDPVLLSVGLTELAHGIATCKSHVFNTSLRCMELPRLTFPHSSGVRRGKSSFQDCDIRLYTGLCT